MAKNIDEIKTDVKLLLARHHEIIGEKRIKKRIDKKAMALLGIVIAAIVSIFKSL
jgi:hypothetical protein